MIRLVQARCPSVRGGASLVARTAKCAVAFGVVLAVVFAGGCGQADLGRAGSPDAIAAALGRSTVVVGRPMNRAGRPIAYLALGGARGARLMAFDLERSTVLWTVKAPMTGRVVAGASVVTYADGGVLVARDGTTGAERWRSDVPAGEHLVGYAMDGDTVYFVARRGRELRGGEAEIVALDGSSGSVLWRRALGSANVAAPDARGGIVAVPNRSQFVSLMDGRTGEPLGQVLSKQQAVDFVRALPEGFFYGYGSDGFFLMSADTAVGVRSAPGYLHVPFPPFVRSVYHFDMYRPELMDYSAIDRNRVLWRAKVEGTRASFADGTVCVLDFRFFFGFDAASGTLRWAYNNPVVEAIGAAHTGAAIVFATADGDLGALDPRTGQRMYRFHLAGQGEIVTGATFDAEGYAPHGGDIGASASPSLADVLSSIVWDPDRRFFEVQTFAVDQLSRIPGRAVTAALLKMLSQEGMPPAIVNRAARALGERKDPEAVDLFVDAIRVHADYVTSSKAANLDVLARAVGALPATQAAEPLAAHLRLPETEPSTVVEIARALKTMRARETLPALRDYLTMYRADSTYEGDPSALWAVVDALAEMGGVAERELLLYLAEDQRTLPAVRQRAHHALTQTAPGSEGTTDRLGSKAPATDPSGAARAVSPARD